MGLALIGPWCYLPFPNLSLWRRNLMQWLPWPRSHAKVQKPVGWNQSIKIMCTQSRGVLRNKGKSWKQLVAPSDGGPAQGWCEAGRPGIPDQVSLESNCFGMQPKVGGKLHQRLNTCTRPIVTKFCKGKLKRTLEREFKRVWNH